MIRNQNPGAHLGKWLGSRDPDHIARWVAAQHAAKRALPQCQAVSRTTGERCRHRVRHGPVCCYHARGALAVEADRALEARNAKILARPNKTQRERAERSMRRIARARLHRQWRIDPRIEGSTLALTDADEARVAAWLRQQSDVDLSRPLPGSSRLPTPRAVDRMRWAAWRVLRRGRSASTEFEEAARLRVAAAIRDDLRFWTKWDRLGGEEG